MPVITQAAVIAVGDEVLHGETINTNAAYLAQQLIAHGVRVAYHLTVGDDRKQVAEGVQRALEAVDLVLVVGGLGPTHDDITAEAVAQAVGASLVFSPTVDAWIRARHGTGPGREASIRRQSTVIQGADLLRNPRGTAPGQRLAVGSRWVVLLPGPPREMQAIFETHLSPWLAGLGQPAVLRDTWTSYEWGESAVAHLVSELVHGQHPRVGLYASPGVVEIRLEGQADIGPGQSLVVARAGAWLVGRFPGRLYHHARQAPLATWIVEALQRRGWRIGVMESLTGGLVASRLIEVPGASTVLPMAVVAYSDAAKVAMGVPAATVERYGAVSPQVAAAMAQAARDRAGADLGLSTTGYAGPGGGTARYPVGTYFVGIAWGEGVRVRRRQLGVERQGVRAGATELALALLWETLQHPWPPMLAQDR
ncbi:MAG: nicotinamide-nucleotide amidohydrolase family protein [Firmicutes bacterium]|nr:nicotinamide-nucleotide amidohydrolase family protein [Alicyclobacillaceae bacterium]MCL6496866.1 nicotinamide-nucleotide amidohydrolase family protein [Bacillota bacterium]